MTPGTLTPSQHPLHPAERGGARTLSLGWAAGAAPWLLPAVPWLLPAALWLLPAAAGAAGGEVHGNPWGDFLWKVVNFAILVGLLYFVLRKPVGRALRGAAQRARQALSDSRESAEVTIQRLEDQRKSIANLQLELERLKEDARAETAAEGERLKRDAEALAERLKRQVQQRVEQAGNQALETLRGELADEAVRAAEGLIRERMDNAAQKKLVQEHIDGLERFS